MWSRSGRELFYLTEDSLYAARLGTGSTFSVEDVRALFRVPPYSFRSGIDVLPGDSLFVMIETELGGTDRIAVTVHFEEGLRALATPRTPARSRQ